MLISQPDAQHPQLYVDIDVCVCVHIMDYCDIKREGSHNTD